MSEVTRMMHHHTAQAASLHINNLRTFFKGRSGIQVLEIYYRALVRSSGGTGFVAVVNGDVIGYICGIWDAASIRNVLIKHYWARLLFWLGWQVVENPDILKEIFDRMLSRQERGKQRSSNGCELRPIVVSKQARGKGLAEKLLIALLDDAKHRGFSSIYLKTETDNTSANRFYSKSGFKLAGSYENAYQKYHIFRISTQSNKRDN